MEIMNFSRKPKSNPHKNPGFFLESLSLKWIAVRLGTVLESDVKANLRIKLLVLIINQSLNYIRF